MVNKTQKRMTGVMALALLLGSLCGLTLLAPATEAQQRERTRAEKIQRFRALAPERQRIIWQQWRDRLQARPSREARLARLAARQQRFAKFMERLRNGDVVLREQIIATDASEDGLLRARELGFTVLRDERIEALGQRLTLLQVARGARLEEALANLRSADPAGDYDYNHVMDGSAAGIASVPLGLAQAGSAATPTAVRIGLIDSGVARDVPALAAATIRARGFASDAQVVGDAHGTAIASMLVGQVRGIQSLLPGATLYAADIYGDAGDGGSADAVLRALGWMAAEKVPVINMSIVGPRNRAVEKALATLIARGFVIVAAVGNDGPAAPPLYPAAYPGVVGVTAVDQKQRILLEANQGVQVEFAALGADVKVVDPEGMMIKVRGTSFAAPVIAARLAAQMFHTDPAATRIMREQLQVEAIDLGSKGRDTVYGYGLIRAPQI